MGRQSASSSSRSSSTSSNNNKNGMIGLCIFMGVAVVASLVTAANAAKKRQKKTKHVKTGRLLSEMEQYVANSIRVNMPPARRMGIAVDKVHLRQRGGEDNNNNDDAGSVSLSMPIKGNTNVHGTAFAGSLYSLCVLSAWYTLVCHLRDTLGDDVLNQSMTVVVQSAEIAYKRPLWNIEDNETIVATSFLSSGDAEWKIFISQLQETGKINCNISGEIRIPKPPSSSSSHTTTATTTTATTTATTNAQDAKKETVKAVEFKALLCVMLSRSDS